jgi:hypothetical protein
VKAEQTVGKQHIWWNLILNYNNSGVDVCVAEQYNNQIRGLKTFVAEAYDSATGEWTIPMKWD